MITRLDFEITPQPDDATCGPACLHAVYRHLGDEQPMAGIVGEVESLESGGTLAVYLALHALQRGYEATIYTCNLQLFDPTWFGRGKAYLRSRLIAQADAKDDTKIRSATSGYLDYIALGGELLMADVTPELLRRTLEEEGPIIAGLSMTWLYQCMRERPGDDEPDDARGEPVGHFVVIHGIDPATGRVRIADPYLHLPYPGSHHYEVEVDRVIGAVLLGIVTFDAKLLVIRRRNGVGGG